MEHSAVVLKAVSEVLPLERFIWAVIPSSKQNTDVNGKHTQALGWVTVRTASGHRAPPCCPQVRSAARAEPSTGAGVPCRETGRAEKSRGRGGLAAVTQRRGAPGSDRYFLFPCRRRGC